MAKATKNDASRIEDAPDREAVPVSDVASRPPEKNTAGRSNSKKAASLNPGDCVYMGSPGVTYTGAGSPPGLDVLIVAPRRGFVVVEGTTTHATEFPKLVEKFLFRPNDWVELIR